MELEALYIADPMCGWCWGFAPVSRALANAIAGRAALRVVPGGLAVDTRAPLLPGEVKTIIDEWRRVHEATAQPFDFDHPVDEHTVFDTGPSCRALALVARAQPAKALDYLHALQHAYYVDRRDLRDAAVLTTCARDNGIPAATLEGRIDSTEAREALDEDRQLVQALGIHGFPAVALRSDHRIQLLTLGYRPWDDLAPHVQNWLQQG